MKNFDIINRYSNSIQGKIQIRKTTFVLMTLSFIILNFFIASFLNVQWMKKETKATYFFTADFQKDIPEGEKEKTEIDILKLDGVRKVRYVSKEEAFQKLQYQLDIAIPKSENPLSDSLIIYFNEPSDIEGIQVKLESNQNIKEFFVDGTYIAYKDREVRFFKILSWCLGILCIAPLIMMIYLTYYSSISIDYINNVGIIQNDMVNRKRSKTVNAFPLIASATMGTLIFFNIYIYFRNHLLDISGNYLILSLKEIVFMQCLILFIVVLLMLLKPVKIMVLKRGES
ncbi:MULTISPECIES: permease-like cell division protein FtsX [Fusobacterium]|jgi:cell division transport system permease protein|uniref:Cell division protein FtsX n=1 Tax=Fusobacterium hominis TaxID=2764326 RepID=A0A7G9GW77_9FUSO|nr:MULTISPECIES: permease-like cell division protein FtsX [Fusobacterium]QNM15059.1 cell division protein FtsX [Fusobacterium hominis]